MPCRLRHQRGHYAARRGQGAHPQAAALPRHQLLHHAMGAPAAWAATMACLCRAWVHLRRQAALSLQEGDKGAVRHCRGPMRPRPRTQGNAGGRRRSQDGSGRVRRRSLLSSCSSISPQCRAVIGSIHAPSHLQSYSSLRAQCKMETVPTAMETGRQWQQNVGRHWRQSGRFATLFVQRWASRRQLGALALVLLLELSLRPFSQVHVICIGCERFASP